MVGELYRLSRLHFSWRDQPCTKLLAQLSFETHDTIPKYTISDAQDSSPFSQGGHAAAGAGRFAGCVHVIRQGTATVAPGDNHGQRLRRLSAAASAGEIVCAH